MKNIVIFIVKGNKRFLRISNPNYYSSREQLSLRNQAKMNNNYISNNNNFGIYNNNSAQFSTKGSFNDSIDSPNNNYRYNIMPKKLDFNSNYGSANRPINPQISPMNYHSYNTPTPPIQNNFTQNQNFKLLPKPNSYGDVEFSRYCSTPNPKYNNNYNITKDAYLFSPNKPQNFKSPQIQSGYAYHQNIISNNQICQNSLTGINQIPPKRENKKRRNTIQAGDGKLIFKKNDTPKTPKLNYTSYEINLENVSQILEKMKILKLLDSDDERH